MTNQIMRRLEQLESLMDARDNEPKMEFILAFVEPADGAQPRNVKYYKCGAACKLERVHDDGSPWEDEQQ